MCGLLQKALIQVVFVKPPLNLYYLKIVVFFHLSSTLNYIQGKGKMKGSLGVIKRRNGVNVNVTISSIITTENQDFRSLHHP